MGRALRFVLPCVFMLLVLLVFYRSSLEDFFFFDDFVYLERSQIGSLRDIPALFSVERARFGLSEQNHSYRPLSTNLYFGLLQLVFGPRPFPFHLANLLLLTTNAILVWRLLSLLGIGSATGFAFALVYAAGSANFDSQLWLSVCQELIFEMNALLAIVLFDRGTAKDRRLPRWLALGAYGLALLSKEMAITVPVVMFLLGIVVRRLRTRDLLGRLSPFLLMTVAYLIWRSANFQFPSEGPYALKVGSFVASHLVQYALWSVEAFFGSGQKEVALLAVIALAVGFLLLPRERKSHFAFFLMWFLVSLLPVLFMPNHIFRYYLAFPMVGVVGAIALVADDRLRRTSARPTAAIVLVGAVATFTGLSSRKFSREAAGRARLTATFAEIIRQTRLLVPSPQDGTLFLYSFPEPAWGSLLLKADGAALRFFYHDHTLKARQLRSDDLSALPPQPAGDTVALRWDQELGVLSRLPATRAE